MHLASPGELVKSLSEVLGLPLPTIVYYDRELSTRGLRSKSGRGRSAAKITSRDAANLLASILGTAQIKGAAEVVAELAMVRAHRARSTEGLFRGSNIAELAALPARHSFLDALEALIEAFAYGSLGKDSNASPPAIEVSALMDGAAAELSLSGQQIGGVVRVRYASADAQQPRRLRVKSREGDLREFRKVTEETIVALARAVADQGSAS